MKFNKKFKNSKGMWGYISKILIEKGYSYLYAENEEEIEVYHIYEDKGVDHIYNQDIIVGKILYNDISKTAIVKLFSYPDEKYVFKIESSYMDAMKDIFNTSFTKYLDELTEIFAEKPLEIKQKILIDLLELKKKYNEEDEELNYEEIY